MLFGVHAPASFIGTSAVGGQIIAQRPCQGNRIAPKEVGWRDGKTFEERFADLLALAVRVRFQDHRQRGPKVYALHAPEVECIGKGKARAPYEFDCKVSVATPATKPKSLPSQKRGAVSSCCTKALHGNPFDGYTLAPVIAELEALTGIEIRRIHVDKGYRGHNHQEKFRVPISAPQSAPEAAPVPVGWNS